MTTPDPAARAALLRRLSLDGFVPPEDAAPWSAAATSAAFAAEVEAFAAAFWTFSTAERRGQWKALRERGGSARLTELEVGLSVTLRTHTDPDRAKLGEVLRELFTLRPRDRATRRRAWLARDAFPLAVWAGIARDFSASFQSTARLDPLLVQYLEGGLRPGAIGADHPGSTPPVAGPLSAPALRHEPRYGWWVAGVCLAGVVLLVAVLVVGLNEATDRRMSPEDGVFPARAARPTAIRDREAREPDSPDGTHPRPARTRR